MLRRRNRRPCIYKIVFMKSLLRYIYIFVAMVLFAACAVEESYSPNTPTSQPSDPTTYTVMIYGCGGGNLDEVFEPTIDIVTRLDIPTNINIVGEMKWSNGYWSNWSDGKGGVSRLKYDHASNKFNNKSFSDNSFKIDDPSNLAEFIEWAYDEAPADEYIIIFMGHGNAYHPSFEGDTTRGVLRDDEEIAYLGLSGIVEAFELTDAHFGLMSMISCLTNTIEYVTELTPYVDYYLAPNHVTSISGGELYYIIEGLMGIEKHDNTSIPQAAKHYINQDYDLGWSNDYLTIDHTLTHCKKIGDVNSAIREFTDIVVALYQEELKIGSEEMMGRYGFTTATIDEALSNAYYPVNAMFSDDYIAKLEWYRLDYAYDIVDVASKVAKATKHNKISDAAKKIKTAATRAIAYQRDVNLMAVDKVYYTATLINSEQWTTLGMEDMGYEQTAFDRATGWSRLLKVNNATYIHCR